MNDFTKEELEQIYYHMENEPIELMNKVKSLIENYCEHEKTFRDGNMFTACCKCGVIW